MHVVKAYMHTIAYVHKDISYYSHKNKFLKLWICLDHIIRSKDA